MKRTVFLCAVLLVVPVLGIAQSQTKDPKSNDSGTPAVRARVVGTDRAANHVEKQQSNKQTSVNSPAGTDPATGTSGSASPGGAEPKWGNTAVIVRPGSNERVGPLDKAAPAQQRATDQSSQPVKKLVQQTTLMAEAPRPSPLTANANSPKPLAAREPAPTVVYHVGIGDVLDIRLTNLPTRESTLFTVLKNGSLEYPLLNGPLPVAGMTTDEIAKLLSNEIKVLKAARVSVSVRDYASHAVAVTGLVDNPGRRMMRREAMPLFAVLAEALPRSEATQVTLVRNGKSQTISLSDEPAMATLILPGDALKVSGSNGAAMRFVYVGGDVTSRGEREFRDGMTLTQAILSAGTASRGGKISVRVARRDAKGFLKSVEYNLQTIEDGKAPDPLLEAGDRIEVTRGM